MDGAAALQYVRLVADTALPSPVCLVRRVDKHGRVARASGTDGWTLHRRAPGCADAQPDSKQSLKKEPAMRGTYPSRRTTAIALVFSSLLVRGTPAEPGPELTNGGPRSPREELATFRLPKGFHAELVACEPDVVDPVAMAFDEDGRLYVAEMRGYPNAGVATGVVTSGRVKRLENLDRDGHFKTVRVYADNLRFPTAVMPWRGGLLVANAPDLLYLEDPAGTGKATRTRKLYSGFSLNNIQQLVNGLQWGLDNRVHGCAGYDGGTVRSAEKTGAPPVTLRGRGDAASFPMNPAVWNRPAAAVSTAWRRMTLAAGSRRRTVSTCGTSFYPITICGAILCCPSAP